MVHLVLPLMLAAFLPFALTGATKIGVFSGRDNHATRNWQANLTGWRQRAYWAHQNAFETFPMFAAAAIVAFIATRGDTVTTVTTWLYPATRAMYSAMYLADRASPRSLAWAAGMGCIVVLFIRALMV